MFSPTSRYYGLPTRHMTTPRGRQIVYVQRRFIPPPEEYTLLQEHTVEPGERPDLIAHDYLGDAEQFWRIADANNVLAAEELTSEPGRRIRITLPEGMSGAADA